MLSSFGFSIPYSTLYWKWAVVATILGVNFVVNLDRRLVSNRSLVGHWFSQKIQTKTTNTTWNGSFLSRINLFAHTHTALEQEMNKKITIKNEIIWMFHVSFATQLNLRYANVHQIQMIVRKLSWKITMFEIIWNKQNFVCAHLFARKKQKRNCFF